MLEKFIDLGIQPYANAFLNSEKDIENEFLYQLDVGFDKETYSIEMMPETIEQIKPENIFNENYSYRTSCSAPMRRHFRETANMLRNMYKGNKESILEIGSNDGSFIRVWDPNNHTVCVEPCSNFAKETTDMGYKTYDEFWTQDLAEKIVRENGQFGMIYSANCMCHIPNLDEALRGINVALADDGMFIFEDPSASQMIVNSAIDQIYCEHPRIFSILYLDKILKKHGLTIVNVQKLNTHGGSNRIFCLKTDNVKEVMSSLYKEIEYEKMIGLNKISTFLMWAARMYMMRNNLFNILHNAKSLGKKIVGYGCSSKSSIILNFLKVSDEYVDYFVDTTPEKIGKLSPGTHLPIKSFKEGWNESVDIAYLGAWNYTQEIINKEQDFLNRGGRFLTHVPFVRLI